MRNNGYRGRSKATLELLEACKKIIEETQPITVRGVCYRLFVAELIDSMATKNTQKISRLLVDAREKGVIPWEWIVDESRQMEEQSSWKDLAGYAKAIEKSYRRDFWAHQEKRVIVMSEKATVAGILRPVMDEYGVPFFPVHGFNSATKVHDLAEDIANDERRTVLLYVGDYDPSGMFMSEEDLMARLERYDAGLFDLNRISLIDSDLSNLPSFPAKEQDPRYSWYVNQFGEDAWELDAMDPNQLRGRVLSEIKKYVDPSDWEQHKRIEEAERETTKQIAAAIAEAGAK